MSSIVSEEDYESAKNRTKDYFYTELAESYIKEVITSDTKLTISQNLYYPELIEYVTYKVYGHRYSQNANELKFIINCSEGFIGFFPELFV